MIKGAKVHAKPIVLTVAQELYEDGADPTAIIKNWPRLEQMMARVINQAITSLKERKFHPAVLFMDNKGNMLNGLDPTIPDEVMELGRHLLGDDEALERANDSAIQRVVTQKATESECAYVVYAQMAQAGMLGFNTKEEQQKAGHLTPADIDEADMETVMAVEGRARGEAETTLFVIALRKDKKQGWLNGKLTKGRTLEGMSGYLDMAFDGANTPS